VNVDRALLEMSTDSLKNPGDDEPHRKRVTVYVYVTGEYVPHRESIEVVNLHVPKLTTPLAQAHEAFT
jgi:hypothetical protein